MAELVRCPPRASPCLKADAEAIGVEHSIGRIRERVGAVMETIQQLQWQAETLSDQLDSIERELVEVKPR